MSQAGGNSGSGGGGTFNGSPVYFEANLSAPIVKPASNNSSIIYDQVLTNFGNAYNSVTGIFTAPSSGFYGFETVCCLANLSALTGNSETLLAYIGSLQSLTLIRIGPGSFTGVTNFTMSASWAIPMAAGENMKVQVYPSGSGNYQVFGAPAPNATALFNSSTFSGWKIA